MRKHFSSEDLFVLRNHVPINRLIGENLRISFKMSEGFFRYLCPLCREFHTATDSQTNLARCFRCARNFNPIEIVMVFHKMDFVQSVKYLQVYRNTLSNKESPGVRRDHRLIRKQAIVLPKSSERSDCVRHQEWNVHSPSRRASNDVIKLSEILKGLGS